MLSSCLHVPRAPVSLKRTCKRALATQAQGTRHAQGLLSPQIQPLRDSSSQTASTPVTEKSHDLPNTSPTPSADAPSVTLADVLTPTHPLAAATYLVAFACVATDVFAPSSLHVFASIDASAHSWVLTNTSLDAKLFQGAVTSSIAISLGLTGLALSGAASLVKAPARNLPIIALSVLAYFGGMGYVQHGESFLVGTAKEFFHRARPSDLHHSFSFPSGHSSSVTLILGMLLFVFLPMLIRTYSIPTSSGQTVEPSPGVDVTTEPSSSNTLLAGASYLQGNMPVLVGGWALTAVGRVLADVHWVSDTVAGLLFGMVGVSVLTMAVNAYEVQQSN